MNFKKILPLMLAALMIVCVLSGCGGNNADATTTTSGNPVTSVTVNIKVIGADGKAIIDVSNYVYTSSTLAPTPFTVLDDYCYMNMENTAVKVDENTGGLVSIGKTTLGEGQYWDVTVNGKPVNFSEASVATGDSIVITLTTSSAG